MSLTLQAAKANDLNSTASSTDDHQSENIVTQSFNIYHNELKQVFIISDTLIHTCFKNTSFFHTKGKIKYLIITIIHVHRTTLSNLGRAG